jgi:small GTP-binding protein
MNNIGNTDKINIKLVLLGDTDVGKSSIVNNYIYNNYRYTLDSTIGASYTSKIINIYYCPTTYKVCDTDGENIINNKNLRKLIVNLNIWDTAGQERYKSLASMYYKNADVVFYVFDVNKTDNKIDNKIDNEIYTNLKEDSTKILIYNKIDLVDDNIMSMKKNLTYNINIENDGWTTRFVSAKSGKNIEELFTSSIINFLNNNLRKIKTNTSNNFIQLIDNNSTKNYCC